MGISSKINKLRLSARYLALRASARFGAGDKGKTCVLIDLDGLLVTRRSEQVVLQLRNAGFSVSYKMTLGQYVSALYDGETDNQRVFFNNASFYSPKREYAIVFCHRKNAAKYNKRIVFNDDILSFEGAYNSDFYYPIMFHPLKLARDSETDILSAKKDYRIGLIFVGNNSDLYVKYEDVLHNKYKIETRTEVIDCLLKTFPERIVRPEDGKKFLSDLRENRVDYRDKIVIVDKFRLYRNDFWDVLRMSAYHVWTGGYIQPYCHNHIEGICSGAVPIYNGVIKYPGLNDTNSLRYSGLDGFAGIVKELLGSEVCSDRAAKMSDSVREVYKENFSSEAFAEKLNRFIASDKTEEVFYICEGITGE